MAGDRTNHPPPSRAIFMKTRRFPGLCLLLHLLALALVSARSSAAEPFFFIQLSDPQMGMFSDNKDFAQDAANFEFVVAAINRLHPAFVVVTGDLVNKTGD